MNRTAVLLSVVGWAGASLVLAELRWFRRPSLSRRLLPYAAGGASGRPRTSTGSVVVLAPLAQEIVRRLVRLVGSTDQTASRLDRIHSPLTITQFRLRQFGWAIGAFGVAAVLSLALPLPPPIGVLAMLGSPLLSVLVSEQRLALAAARRSDRTLLELPIVAEHLGMLLASGYSLGGALSRLAQRSPGVCGQELSRVCVRIRQGLSDLDALREWERRTQVGAVTRLVNVLALQRESGDLGRLIAEEARAVRREVHRNLIESIERRGQQVWIPVTVATLVPGVLFLSVPFIEAMRLFTTE